MERKEAWIADELENQHLDKIFLKGAKLSSIFSVIGILTSVVLVKIFFVAVTIFIAGMLFIASSFVVLLLMKETKFVKVQERKIRFYLLSSLKDNVKQISNHPSIKIIAIVTFVIGLGSEGFDRLWGAHFITNFHLDEEQSIYWFGAFFVEAFLLNIIFIKILEQLKKEYYSIILIIMNSLLFLVMLGFAFTNYFFIAILFYWFIEGLRNANEPLLRVMINERLQSEGRATTLSMFG